MSDQILIDHDWTVTYQPTPIPMRGRFDSVEAFLKRRAQWERERSDVISISWRVVAPCGECGAAR